MPARHSRVSNRTTARRGTHTALRSSQTGVSFSVLTPLEYGIAYNTVSKGIDAGRVYTSGRYYLGVGRGFLTFPATRQSIVFKSGTRASRSSFPPPGACFLAAHCRLHMT